MKFSTVFTCLVALAPAAVLAAPGFPLTRRAGGHPLTITNNCPNPITPAIADTKCGYSPRCADAVAYSGPQPKEIASKKSSEPLTLDHAWVGRVYAKDPKCGDKGWGCTVLELNLDANTSPTAQAYDISNGQGFTQSVSMSMDGCPQVTCKDVNCSCSDAYKPGDLSGCAATGAVDQPVKTCGVGDIGVHITFCP